MKYKKFYSLACMLLLGVSAAWSSSDKINVLSTSDANVKGLLEYLKLEQIQAQYYANLLNFDPEQASKIGVHDYDNKLTERTAQNEKAFRRALIRNQDELKLIDHASFSKIQLADYKTLLADISKLVYDLNKADRLKKSPQYYLYAADSIFELLDRDFASYNFRAQAALDRLTDFPRILELGKKNVKNPPKFWVEVAINDAVELPDSIDTLIPKLRQMRASDPLAARQIDESIPKAKAAATEYAKFLQTKVLPHADGDYRVGEATYMWYLQNWHYINVRISKLIADTTADFTRTQEDFLRELRGYLKSQTVGIEHYWLTLDMIGENPIDEKDLEKVVRQDMERSARFFDRYRLMPMYTERPVILDMPSYMKSRNFSMTYMPSPPADVKRTSLFYLLKAPKSMTENQKITYAKKYLNRTAIEFELVQTIVPGSAMQNFVAQNASRINRSANVPAITRGWSQYALTLAYNERYYADNDWTRLYYLRNVLIHQADAYVDVMLHTKRMTHEKAVEFLMRETGIGNDEALLRVYFISMNPSVAYAARYGAIELDRVTERQKDRLGSKFDTREYYRNLLMIGNVPINDLQGIVNSLN